MTSRGVLIFKKIAENLETKFYTISFKETVFPIYLKTVCPHLLHTNQTTLIKLMKSSYNYSV